MNTKSFYPCGGASNLILGINRENQIFFLRIPAAVKFFSQNCQIQRHFGANKKSLPTQMHLYDPYRVPTLFPRGIIIFQGLLTKLHFWTKFPVLEKFVNLIKDLKYEHQSIFPL